MTGISQNSLHRHLSQLQERQLLKVAYIGPRCLRRQALVSDRGSALRLPTDLLLSRELPTPAFWVWGVIRRLDSHFDYSLLSSLTGFCPASLSKYVKELRQGGWLVAHGPGKWGRSRVRLRATNPYEIKRQADLAELEAEMAAARARPGYSLGQYLMVRMVKLIVVETVMVERAEVMGLENVETGGQMHYDLFLADSGLALEFHGRQHDGPTELFPSRADYQAQRMRDLIKGGISLERGILLIVVRPSDLSFPRLRELLQGKAPLREVPDAEWHIYKYLERVAARYRRKAGLG